MESVNLKQHLKKKSTKMWLKILTTGNWDKRKMKRMFRLMKEGN